MRAGGADPGQRNTSKASIADFLHDLEPIL